MKLSELLRELEQSTGATYCLEPCHPAWAEIDALQLLPDQYLHHGPVCVRTKLHGGMERCAAAKNRTVERARSGRAFWTYCPFGLLERVQPVRVNGELVAVLYAGHLSGRRTVCPPGPDAAVQPLPASESLKRQLAEQLHLAAALIQWEFSLWRREHGTECRRLRDDRYYCEQAKFFIARHYTEPITLTELAAALHRNVNYLGETIRRLAGKTFRELLNDRRMEEARVYLRFHPQLNITQIAAMCGFADSNYFSTAFRRVTGKSPRQFRHFPSNCQTPEKIP